MIKTYERARGRWQEILPRLGIDRKFLVDRHGPCPACGGKDRFRFDDKDGCGSYFCNQCGAGYGIDLVRKVNGWDYARACNAIDGIIGVDLVPLVRQAQPKKRKRSPESFLVGANNRDLVEAYLVSRGLSTFPEVLKGHDRMAYYDGDRLVGRFPAMLAPVTGEDGVLRSVHRTYLAGVPTRKKLACGVDQGSAAVRLFEPGEVLGVAEGIETAIAAHELFGGLPTWAAISSSLLVRFEPPAGVRRLLVLGDNDVNFTGQKAAFELAHRIHRDHKIEVEVRIPPAAGLDWLDVLNLERTTERAVSRLCA